MSNDRLSYRRHRFPPEIISHAVWLYHRFGLSLRDVEDLLAKRGVIVSYEAIRYWCAKFGPHYAAKLRRRQGRASETESRARRLQASSRTHWRHYASRL